LEEVQIKSLNVGCGCDKWGNVRVDIEHYSSLYDEPTTANVLADIEYLPFKDEVFDEVRCYHTLEHTNNPQHALRELLRVGKVVDVKVPAHNFYCMVINRILALPFTVIWSIRSGNLKHFYQYLKGIKNSGNPLAAHKWYIKLRDSKLIRWKYFPIPSEYHKVYITTDFSGK